MSRSATTSSASTPSAGVSRVARRIPLKPAMHRLPVSTTSPDRGDRRPDTSFRCAKASGSAYLGWDGSAQRADVTRVTGGHGLTRQDLDEAIGAVLDLARESLGMDFGYVTEFRDGVHVTRHLAGDAASFGQGVGTTVRLEESYCRAMVAGELPNAIPDARAHPVTAAMPVTLAMGIGAYVGVPIELSDGRVFGTLCCLDHEPLAGDGTQEAQFLRLLGRLVALAVEQRAQGEALIQTGRDALAHQALHDPLTDLPNRRLL